MALNVAPLLATDIGNAITAKLKSSILTIYSGTQPTYANNDISGCIALVSLSIPSTITGVINTSSGISTLTISGSITGSVQVTGNATFFRISTNGATTGSTALCDGPVSDLGLSSPSLTLGSDVSFPTLSIVIS